VRQSIAAGNTSDDVRAAGVPVEYKRWDWSFISENRFLEFGYSDLKGN